MNLPYRRARSPLGAFYRSPLGVFTRPGGAVRLIIVNSNMPNTIQWPHVETGLYYADAIDLSNPVNGIGIDSLTSTSERLIIGESWRDPWEPAIQAAASSLGATTVSQDFNIGEYVRVRLFEGATDFMVYQTYSFAYGSLQTGSPATDVNPNHIYSADLFANLPDGPEFFLKQLVERNFTGGLTLPFDESEVTNIVVWSRRGVEAEQYGHWLGNRGEYSLVDPNPQPDADNWLRGDQVMTDVMQQDIAAAVAAKRKVHIYHAPEDPYSWENNLLTEPSWFYGVEHSYDLDPGGSYAEALYYTSIDTGLAPWYERTGLGFSLKQFTEPVDCSTFRDAQNQAIQQAWKDNADGTYIQAFDDIVGYDLTAAISRATQ